MCGLEARALERAGQPRVVVPIDLLITDVSMPEITGAEVAQRFRQKFPQLPVLYMSGHSADAFEEEVLLGPDEHYIQKPFALTEIRRLVEAILVGGPLN